DLPQRAHDEVATAGIGRVHALDRPTGAGERRRSGKLDRLEQPRVDVGLQPPVAAYRFRIAEDRGTAPAGHVEALRQREDLYPDLLGARGGEEAGRDVA